MASPTDVGPGLFLVKLDMIPSPGTVFQKAEPTKTLFSGHVSF